MVQKGGDTAGPRPLWLERPCCKAGPWLASRKLALRVSPSPVNLKGGFSVPGLFVQTTWFMLNTCFPFGSLGCQCEAEAAHVSSLRRTALSSESLLGFPGLTPPRRVSGEERAPCDPSWGDGSPGSLTESPLVPPASLSLRTCCESLLPVWRGDLGAQCTPSPLSPPGDSPDRRASEGPSTHLLPEKTLQLLLVLPSTLKPTAASEIYF